MSDAETKQIEGVCEEISEKNGWTAFAINVGSQYPVRISTKLPALIDQGRAAGQQRAMWTFKESQGGENPNKPGTFYTNRYFESVEVGGPTHVPPQGWEQAEKDAAPRPTAQAASSTPTHAPLPPGDKDRAITRMAVLKAAAEITAAEVAGGIASGASADDLAGSTIAIASRFENWVYRDVTDIPF
jgi:hypothetical protein